MYYVLIFAASFIFCLFFTNIIIKFAKKYKITDKPLKNRKIHKKTTPLLGGLAVFLAFFLVLLFFRSQLVAGDLGAKHWLGFFGGGLILMIGGFLDDKYDLKPSLQIIFPILAVFSLVAGGVNIEKISNPLGGYILLDTFRIPVFSWHGAVYYFVVLSDLIIFAWLMGMMYTTKLLDGLDGLVAGVTGIGSMVIFLFTMTAAYYQPDIGLAALVLAGASFGFLVFNWRPAKIFLGEGGSLFLGYALGVLAVISGGKIAIALLVMGIPILDVFWTIIRRLLKKKNPFKFADRKHLHHRLLDIGLGHRQAVLFFYFFSAVFGLSALFLQSRGKILVLGILLFLMLLIIIGFSRFDKKLSKKRNKNDV